MKTSKYALIIVLLSALTLASETSTSNQLPDGLKAILRYEDASTSLERKKKEEEAINKTYAWQGIVNDVESDAEIIVKLNSGNYATVYLVDAIGSTLKKEQFIKFEGVLTSMGSGILFKHEIKNAKITP